MKRNTRKNKRRNNKKYPYKKGGKYRTNKLVLTILFLFVFMFSIANVSAFLSLGHYKQLTNQANYSGTITIGKHLFLFFGKSSPEVDYTLTSNKVSVINGEATGTATLYSDGRLFSGKKFNGGEVRNSKIYIWINQTKQIEVPDYKSECYIDYSNSSNGTSNNLTNGTKICKQIKIGSHNKTIDNSHWQVYNKEKLPAGNYTWKLTGQRKPNQKVDWILTSGIGNKDLNEWDWWNDSWTRKRQINFTADVGQLSYLETIPYYTGMNSDFSDLRFVDTATESTEYIYTIESYTASTSAIVRIYSKGEKSVMMYYGNSGATTTGSASDTYFNPVSMYYLDEQDTTGTGTIIDSVGSNNGTNNGSTNTTGKIGGAYLYGDDDTISVPNLWSSLNGDFSYSFWVKLVDTTAGGMVWASDGSGYSGFTVSGATFYAYLNGNNYITTSSSTGAWVHIVVTYDGADMKMYKNGAYITKLSKSGGMDLTTCDVSIGGDYGNLHGTMDEVEFWDRALTTTEISALYHQTAPTFNIGSEQTSGLTVNITYPQENVNYSENVSTMSYTSSSTPQYCWYSRDSGATNSSLFAGGTNLTNIYSVSGSNTWILYCNDSSGHNATDNVTFNVEKLWNNTGYPTLDKQFRVNEFVNVSGNNFTLAGRPYTLQGVDSYYLVDYATNHTYDDQGNEINNSRQAVDEILNEAHNLGVNVIRIWANMQGANDTYWNINNSGGHYNLVEVQTPGNYSNKTLEAMDWLIYEAGKKDIRLQLVLINNWNEYGGMRWYAEKSPTTDKTYEWVNDTNDDNYWKFHDQFYNDTNCMDYYKNFVSMLLNRNNTVTGRLYKDDPTIFAWLLANEPRAKTDGDGSNHLIEDWTKNMTAYIKSIDSKHLVGLGIEGWGEPWEGTNFVDDQNNTGLDFATFELHPDQWDWFAQRGENATDEAWQTGGVNSTATIDWWTNLTNESWNNRYETSYIPNYDPALARHQYDNWIKQNTEWANDLNMPVLMQEFAMPSSSNDSIKDRFFQQAIHTFFSNGGDGLMYWNLNHDNYYYSTDPDGIMDDGYSFYVSDDPVLKAKSQSVMDAFNFTEHDNNGGSWVVSLNNYGYDFITNVGWANDIHILNSTLFLNISDGTTWRQEQESNTTELIPNQNNTINKQFNNNDTEFYWHTTVYASDGTTLTSSETYERIVPTIDISSLDGDTFDYLPEGFNLTLNTTITDDYLDTCWYDYNNTNTFFSCSSGVNNVINVSYEAGDDDLIIYANNTYGLIGSRSISWTTKVAESSREVSSQSYQTQNEDYKINLIANSSLTSVKLDYNGTIYDTTKSGNEYSTNFDVPLDYLGNNSVRWKFTYAGNTIYSNYSYQNVDELVWTICNSSYTTKFLNISFKDEASLDDINASIQTSSFVYYLGSGSVNKTYTYQNLTDNYNYNFCATPNLNISVNPYIQYKQGTIYPQRVYDPSVLTYNNTMTHTILYLLKYTDGLSVTFQVVNTANQVLSDVDVSATRTISGEEVEVSKGTTGASGTVTFYLNPDFTHTFTFIKSGYTTYTTSFTPTQQSYTVTLSSGSTSTEENYVKGIEYSILPTNISLLNDTIYTFGLNVTSSYWDLEKYGFDLKLDNGTIITGKTSTSSGTLITLDYNVSNQTRIYMDYYWLINGTYTNGTRSWIVYNTLNTQWSIKVFFEDFSSYMNSGFFGIDNFGRYLIIFIIIFFSVGIIGYKFGFNSPTFLSVLTFMVIFFFDSVVNVIPTLSLPNGIAVPHLLTFISGLVMVIIVIREATK